MTTKTTTVTGGTTAVRLDNQSDPSSEDGEHMTYYNAGAIDVWLGDAAVSVGSGIRLAAGGIANERLFGGARRYAIASTACQVNVDQVGA